MRSNTLDTCSLCWKSPTKITVRGEGEETVALCANCLKEVKEAEANKDTPIKDIKLKNPQELCTNCGLCCYMLQISIPKVEAKRLVDTTGVPHEKIFKPHKDDQDSNVCEIELPCHFLTGRPMQYTLCGAYGKGGRPGICKAYICKIGIMYALGLKTLSFSLYELRRAALLRDVGVFNNYLLSEGSKSAQMTYEIVKGLDRFRKEGAPEEVASYLAAEALSRKWFFRSPEDHALFSMQMEQANLGNFDPKLFVPHLVLKSFTEKEAKLASNVIGYVMEMILDYVEPARQELLDEVEEELEVGIPEAKRITAPKKIFKLKDSPLVGDSKEALEENHEQLRRKYRKLKGKHCKLKSAFEELNKEQEDIKWRYTTACNESLIATQKMHTAELYANQLSGDNEVLKAKCASLERALIRVTSESEEHKDNAKMLHDQLMELTGGSETPDVYLELDKENKYGKED